MADGKMKKRGETEDQDLIEIKGKKKRKNKYFENGSIEA